MNKITRCQPGQSAEMRKKTTGQGEEQRLRDGQRKTEQPCMNGHEMQSGNHKTSKRDSILPQTPRRVGHECKKNN